MVSARDDNHARCDWIPDNRAKGAIERTRNDVGGGFHRIRFPPPASLSQRLRGEKISPFIITGIASHG